jgi:hypothetical protein
MKNQNATTKPETPAELSCTDLLGHAWLITYQDKDIKPDGIGRIIHMDKNEAKAELLCFAEPMKDDGDPRLSKWTYDGIIDAEIAARLWPKLSALLCAKIRRVKLMA